MLIHISENFTAFPKELLLGYQGEHNARTIEFTMPDIADTYVLRFEYSDGVVYDVPIVDGNVNITGSLLREVGEVDLQWLAFKRDGQTYELVAKSQIFKGIVRPSISDDIAPIPTYEQSQTMLDQLNEGINAKLTKPAVEGIRGQVIISNGDGTVRYDNIEGTGYDDTEVRELIAENETAIEALDSSKADKTEIPTSTSDLDNDSGFVADENYQHTDNNYTSAEKQKLAGLSNYDDTALRALIAQKATTADIATYINAHKEELKGDDGVGIDTVIINNNGELVITLTDSTTVNVGKVKGSDGQDGSNGISVTNTQVDNNGNLIITLSDSSTINAGHVVGADGQDGSNGSDGVSITNASMNNSGELVLTFSNGNTVNVGRVKGQDGQDGSDYILTSADKTAIATEVVSMLPIYNGGVE